MPLIALKTLKPEDPNFACAGFIGWPWRLLFSNAGKGGFNNVPHETCFGHKYLEVTIISG